MGKQKVIVEKQLGIPPDYQYKALRSKNYLQSNWHRNKLAVLNYLLDLNKNVTVLDLGIGSGNFELQFGAKLKHITAVDYNDEALIFLKLELKKRKSLNVRIILSDIRQVHKKVRLKKFDLILLMDVIEHIRIKDAAAVIKNLRQLLKKDGKVCVITPNYHSPWRVIELLLDKVSTLPKFEEEQHLAKFYPENLTSIFTDQNYKKVFLGTFNLFSYLAPFKSASQFLLRLELKFLKRGGNLLVGVFQLRH